MTYRYVYMNTISPRDTYNILHMSTSNALNGGHPGALPDRLDELPPKDELWFSSSSKKLHSGASTFCVKAEHVTLQ